jgi:S1-C subfamily serine protease/mono/diheme cytochrome c family protein
VAAGIVLSAAHALAAPEPQRLAFLLEYVGSDYPNAVRDGAVVDQFEYGEVLRLVKELRRDYATVPRRAPAVATGLEELERAITQRAPADDVWSATRRLLPKLRASVGGAATLQRMPNLANGRRLWAADCALCHGIMGAGDGWAAREEMKPRPTAFRGDWLERLSPRQVYNAISLGVDGTAMPSFADAYTEAQRWDVAFFTMTLRVGFSPARPPKPVRLPLDDVADASNAELLARLRTERPETSPEELDWYRTNLVSPAGDAAPLAGLATAPSGGLALALQLQDVFAGIAEKVGPRIVGVTSFLRDPSWTSERLQQERGDGWMVANADAVRHSGFRPYRTGSGLLLDDGIIASSDHLIRDDAGKVVPFVEVELHDESRVPTAVVGAEPMLDLAILRIAGALPAPPPPIELGDSDRVQTGHWVVGLGDPPGPSRSIAVGLVSAAPIRQCYQAVLTSTRLQSSLVVDDGALGGPVVDITGQVVGISVRQQTEPGAAPASVIMPINLVLTLSEALQVARSARSPWIGISVLELPALRRRLGAQASTTKMPQTGVYIDDVFDPSPASRAGIRPGAFLVGLGGHPVLSVGDFQTWLYVAGIDTPVELELVRDGETSRSTVTIEARPPSATTQ